MIKKIEHIGIVVSNMDRSIHFYETVLGLSLRSRQFLNEQVELAFLSYPNHSNVEIELISDKGEIEVEGKVNHLAFTVDNIEEEINRLNQLDVKMVDFEPRIVLKEHIKIAFFEGPDGEKLELVER